MKLTFEQRRTITVLKNKGFKEGKDFRVVWFGENAEIKKVKTPVMDQKIPTTQKRVDIQIAD